MGEKQSTKINAIIAQLPCSLCDHLTFIWYDRQRENANCFLVVRGATFYFPSFFPFLFINFYINLWNFLAIIIVHLLSACDYLHRCYYDISASVISFIDYFNYMDYFFYVLIDECYIKARSSPFWPTSTTPSSTITTATARKLWNFPILINLLLSIRWI